MTSPSVAWRWGMAGLLPGMAMLLATLVVLTGCAGSRSGADARNEPVTESDETPERRRSRIRMELAAGYFEQGRTDVALDEVKQVIANDPSLPQAYNLRGLIHMRMNDPRQADESFRRAAALDSRDADIRHNWGWLQCQQARYVEAMQNFELALTIPTYLGRAKTLMAQGVCQARAGRGEEAERSLARSYELDAANPVTGYNLARLLFLRGQLERAQFYIRRLNNGEYANAETLWLGVKVENKIGDKVAMGQLADQLRKRFPQAREVAALERGAFDE